jgi:hypothetical protein
MEKIYTERETGGDYRNPHNTIEFPRPPSATRFCKPAKKKSDESAESGERKSLDDGILSIAQIAC